MDGLRDKLSNVFENKDKDALKAYDGIEGLAKTLKSDIINGLADKEISKERRDKFVEESQK